MRMFAISDSILAPYTLDPVLLTAGTCDEKLRKGELFSKSLHVHIISTTNHCGGKGGKK